MRDSSITNKERLEHILDAIKNINSFVGDVGKEDFLSDVVMQSAVLYQFAVIGEAVVNIDSELLDKYSYPWHYVRSFRNFILHEYHAIEMWVIWDTVINDLPELKKIIEIIIKEL